MKKRLYSFFAVVLSFCLLFSSAAALTSDQLKELLTENYIDAIPDSTLSLTTVDDIIEALNDPYTTYFTKEEYEDFLASMEDTTKIGLGIAIQANDDGWMITQVLEDSGAAAAGVTAGEIITAVDGTSVAGVGTDEATKYLSGDESTQVVVTLEAQDGTTRDVTVTRTEFTASITASTELLQDHIGYIDCTAFGSETLQHFTDGITDNDSSADIWLVDLRLNGGGDAGVAIHSAATLSGGLGYSPLAYLKNRAGQYTGYIATDSRLSTDPSIILVSEYTASAAELFASVFRDMGTGIVVGNRTYGKGVAQVVFNESTNPEDFTDGDALKMTAYRVYSCVGTTTDKIGVIPDLLISDENAAEAAVLLCASEPADSEGYVRLTLGGLNYYINTADATASDDSLAAFTELLEAVPASASACLGQGGTDWLDVGANIIAMSYCPDYVSRSFTDVSGSDYEDAINTLATYELVNGSGDGTFDPEGTLTRAQLCAMLTQILNHTGDAATAASVFSDVSADAWYADDVAMMYQMGLVDGFEDGTFRPDDVVTHEQLLTICERFAAWLSASVNSLDGNVSDGSATIDTSEETSQGFSSWSANATWILNYYQLLYTDLTNITPTSATERQEAAALLYNLLYAVNVLRS
ncbi:MAG: peptidase [Oscillospiraceae bacterium]|nr:peptidase [Oscillospiraceae bacterium]